MFVIIRWDEKQQGVLLDFKSLKVSSEGDIVDE